MISPMAVDPEYRAYQTALYESLAGATIAVRDAAPLLILDRVTAAAITATAGRTAALPLLAPLADVAAESSLEAAIGRAREQFATPQAFGEAIYCARCLARDPSGTLRLLAGRTYLEVAGILPGRTDLIADRSAVTGTTRFAEHWTDAGRLDWMLNLIDLWKRAYVRAYLEPHAAYNTALAQAVDQIDGLQSVAAALERLNGLRRLGPPLAVAALQRFRQMERLFPCSRDDAALLGDLADSPFCGECGFALDQEAPLTETRQVIQALERGLAGQQARLARRVVSRLLSRPAVNGETRLRRFIEVVQAADLAGLTSVLDDELVRFLDELLADQAEAGVLNALAEAYPEITAANLDAAVGELRRLLADQLQREGTVRLLGVEET